MSPQIVRQVMVTGDTVDTCQNCGWTSTLQPAQPSMARSQAAQQYYTYYPAGGAVSISSPKLDTAKIDELSGVEAKMVLPEVRIPDLTECIVGWRGWLVKVVDGRYRLAGVGVDHVWEPKKPLQATCKQPSLSSFSYSYSWGDEPVEVKPHDCPSKDCSCGVWAFHSLDEFKKMGESYYQTAVVGTVYLWGRVLECENGYRAEYAYPKELWVMNKEHRSLSWLYNCPIRVIE